MSDSQAKQPRQVVIVGGGVMGCMIAYQLALREKDLSITLIERCAVACASSGRAGGFLARDWCDSLPTEQLTRLSYQMHAELAAVLPCSYDYRPVTTVEANRDPRHSPSASSSSSSSSAGWLDGEHVSVDPKADSSTTAQLHPYKFTHALLEATRRLEALRELVHGTLHEVVFSGSASASASASALHEVVFSASASASASASSALDGLPAVTAIQVMIDDSSGEQLREIPLHEDDEVVFALGPWSDQLRRWFSTFPAGAPYKCQSYRMQPAMPVPAEAVFGYVRDEADELHILEVYPRPDGEVYACAGMHQDAQVPLPDDPAEIAADLDKLAELQHAVGLLSSRLRGGHFVAGTSCYLPTSADQLPIIGRLRARNAYVCTGHSCWGILQSPASGLAVAELLLNGKSTTVDLSPFDPERFCSADK
eukprot:CAMPEP_0177665784 /NCGR_PEP_ID=MMETSP0447-20121125/21239_1 /TAXON_ID=0 /ORGANISM="Stygamoeba regulata, Strain BSH-02190019" /LENGTH=423 /DNA_ID=CAMNT_0019171901 /DNA_START=59 /DNA_END=1330 /DNA_ORIENTATION=-